MSRTTWEYLIVSENPISPEKLHSVGEDGWEMMSSEWGGLGLCGAVLKRPKAAEAEVYLEDRIAEAVGRCGELAGNTTVCYAGLGTDVLMGYVAMAWLAVTSEGGEFVREFPLHEFGDTPGEAVDQLEASIKRALQTAGGQ